MIAGRIRWIAVALMAGFAADAAAQGAFLKAFKFFNTPTGGTVYETQPVTYLVSVQNIGSGNQADNPGPEVTDQLPSQVTLVSASATAGTLTVDIPNNQILWNGSLAPSAVVNITIQATVNAGTAGQFASNRASLFFDSDGNGTNENFDISSQALFQILPATLLPAMSHIALIALALMLAFIALRR